MPLITACLVAVLWRELGRGHVAPFLCAIALFAISCLGIAISLWPMLVLWHYTLWKAASCEGTQTFLLAGTLFLLPAIAVDIGWSYSMFRGKVRGNVSCY